MPRRPRVDLPQCWQVVSATVRARDGPDRVDQVYRLLLSPLSSAEGRLVGKYARRPRVAGVAIGSCDLNGTKEQADAGSHLCPSLH